MTAASIPQLLLDRSAASPERPFLRFGDRRLSFGEVDRLTARLANRLIELGVAPGDRVAIMLPNGLEYPVTWLAVLRAGGIVVPVNAAYQESDLRHVLTDSGAGSVVTVNEHVRLVDRVGEACSELDRVLVWDGESSVKGGNPTARLSLQDQLNGVSDRHQLGAITASTVAVLQYTSGTTGFPKGCVTTHESWLRAAANFERLGNFTPDDVAVIMTPLCYGDFGWNLVLCLHVGMELAILPRFSASTFWRSIHEMGGTFFSCLGTMPTLLLKQPADPALDRGHRVRWVSCSGIPADQHETIERRWGAPWREAYGTTEIGFVAATMLSDTGMTGSGSIGRMLPGYEGRLIDGEGRDVAEGEIGEFLCRGPGFSEGYWNNPDATAAWMRDGWAHTGDLMRRDAAGNYRLVGRTKDMIRRGGENIAAAEVEAVLREHPRVANAACIAVADDVRGEEVKAFIQTGGAELDPVALLEHCRAHLASFKVPRYVTFVSDFPLTPSQRVEKHKLPKAVSECFDAQTGAWR